MVKHNPVLVVMNHLMVSTGFASRTPESCPMSTMAGASLTAGIWFLTSLGFHQEGSRDSEMHCIKTISVSLLTVFLILFLVDLIVN